MPADEEAATSSSSRDCCQMVVFGQCHHWCGLNIRTATVAVMIENLILAIIGLFLSNLLHIDDFMGSLQVVVGVSGIVTACVIFMSTNETGPASGSSVLLKAALVVLFLISVWWVVSIVMLYHEVGATRAEPGDWALAVYRSIMMLTQSVTVINHMLLAYLVSKAMGAQEALEALRKGGPTESDPLKPVWPPPTS